MKISVIIAIYKDIESLDLILKSLANQTYRESFEIIIAEDGNSVEVRDFVSSLSYKNILHTTQIDNGWQKNRSLNNAIKESSGELLIFLDGDCIPYSNLVENYEKNADKKTILCGRRVDLGDRYSSKLRSSEYDIKDIENSYLRHYFGMYRDGVRHYEEGIKFNNFLYSLKYKNRSSHILGCNFALNKKDILDINGFDEDYITPSVGEDVDIEYRLTQNGCIMKPTRNLTNVLHLYHKIKYDKESNDISMGIYNKIREENIIICKNGIIKKDEDDNSC